MGERVSGARHRIGLILLAVAAGLLWTAPSGADDKGVPWKDYERALKEARDKERPIFLYFFVDSCVYCRKMDSQTLVAGRVVDHLKEGFISVRINADRTPELARKYMVRGFPTSWFLSPTGETISSLPGYLGPEEFSKVLRYIGGGHYRSKSLRAYMEGS